MKEYKDLVELLKRVQSEHGFNCDTDSICEYQDMIAHSGIDQLEELANGNYKEAFYKIYGVAYGTIEAIKFHCQHGKKIIDLFEKIADQEAEIDKLNYLLEDEKKKRKEQSEMIDRNNKLFLEVEDKLTQQQQRADKLEAENTKLKARLYDIITA